MTCDRDCSMVCLRVERAHATNMPVRSEGVWGPCPPKTAPNQHFSANCPVLQSRKLLNFAGVRHLQQPHTTPTLFLRLLECIRYVQAKHALLMLQFKCTREGQARAARRLVYCRGAALPSDVGGYQHMPLNVIDGMQTEIAAMQTPSAHRRF